MVEHRSIVRLVKKTSLASQTEARGSVAHISNLAFDAATWEIYMPILNGGTVVCIDHMTVLNPTALLHAFSGNKIRSAFFSTALLKQRLDEMPTIFSGLDLLLAGGETMKPQDASKARQSVRGTFCHVYGPTENTTFSTVYRMGPEELCVNGVPIGRAINNSGAFVMDSQQQVVPTGVMGELVVTGDGLARGYTEAELDRDRFVQVTVDGRRLKAYRTGDRVRYRPQDGQIEFFGRMDQQVKIRGHRIEPAEVEHAILSHNRVRDAAVVVRKQEGQDPEMIGFVVATGDESKSTEQTEVRSQVEGVGEPFRLEHICEYQDY